MGLRGCLVCRGFRDEWRGRMGFIGFIGAKGVWVWVPERPQELCGRCMVAGADLDACWHWFVDCPRRRLGE